MVSLRTLIDRDRARGEAITVVFRLPGDGFVARVGAGSIDIARGEDAGADVTFTGDTIAIRRTIYGKEGFDGDGLLAVEGDRNLAQRFVDLFALPNKVPA